MARRLFDRVVRDGFRAAEAKQEPAQALVAYFEVGARASVELSLEFLRDLQATPEGRSLNDEYILARVRGFEELVEAGVADQTFARCHAGAAAQIAMGAAQRLRQPEVLSAMNLSVEQAFREFYALFLNGLLSREGDKVGAPRVHRSKARRARPKQKASAVNAGKRT